MKASSLPAAEAAIVRAEPRFVPLVHAFAPCTLGGRVARAHFEALARSIAYQQLAGAAATTIWNRTRALVPGRFTAEAILALPVEALRAAGLSNAKTLSILDLAANTADGTVPLARLSRMGDDEIVERLIVVRGIGRWTAEMFLMFQLGRIDIWPGGDYGVRKGYSLVAELGDVPTEKQMPELGAPFAPYRSVAAWYCWRAVEGEAAARAE